MATTITDAFSAYGVQLKNSRWSMCGLARDGSLVVCLWQQYLKTERHGNEKVMAYNDRLSGWLGNEYGRDEFAALLTKVQEEELSIRLIIASPKRLTDEALVGRVADESKIEKAFDVRTDVVGRLESFDGDSLRIEFRRAM